MQEERAESLKVDVEASSAESGKFIEQINVAKKAYIPSTCKGCVLFLNVNKCL